MKKVSSVRQARCVRPVSCARPSVRALRRTLAAPLRAVQGDVDEGIDDSETEQDGEMSPGTIPPLALLPAQLKKSVTITYAGGRELTIETGEIGRQSGGAVMVTSGDTMVYATACCDRVAMGDGSFTPLSVNYHERFSAAGRTSGGFIKRDGRPKERETLTSRLIDRPLRPMFPSGWAFDTQILEWVMSYDPDHEPSVHAVTAAAAALLVSEVPFTKAVAGVQVGFVDGEFIINPTASQREASALDLKMAGTASAVLMIEGFCDFLTEEQMLEAIALGQAAISEICVQLQTWADEVAKPKRTADLLSLPEELIDMCFKECPEEMRKAYMIGNKQTRGKAVAELRAQVVDSVSEATSRDDYSIAQISRACKKFESTTMRRLLLDEGVRPDGRAVDEIRPISSRCGLLPRTHGSVLFTRGETQTICTATLGNKDAAQLGETLALSHSDSAQRFYLQYFFPPSSVGETGRMGGPNRRELGHGMLAQRAVAPCLPPHESFPYVVRVESHITESNGSSSMASVCGACLSMLDAGVPLNRPVAGVAMGLVLEPDGSFVVLTDILGLEDALGDMDFKVAGDGEGLTAFQMDIKVEGITLEIMKVALAAAKKGRTHVLGEMQKADPGPAGELGPGVPRMVSLTVPTEKIGAIIGSGGKTINGIREAFELTSVDIEDDGRVAIAASSQLNCERALRYITDLVMEIEVGMTFTDCVVLKVIEIGAIVSLPGGRDGLVHISEVSMEPVNRVEDAVKEGDEVSVIVQKVGMGKFSLSIAALQRAALGLPEPERRPRAGRGDGGRGRGGRGRGRGGRDD